MLARISGFIALFSKSNAQKYFEIWSSILNKSKLANTCTSTSRVSASPALFPAVANPAPQSVSIVRTLIIRWTKIQGQARKVML
jgi:hypothetical protein